MLYKVGHLHCLVQGLSKISWNTPGTLHFKMKKGKVNDVKVVVKYYLKGLPLKTQVCARTHGQKKVLQTSRCFSLNALLHLVPSHLHVGIKYWKKDPQFVSVASNCEYFCLLCRQTFPQVSCAAVSQDGDKRLLIGAKLLFSGFEESLQPQKHNTDLILKKKKKSVEPNCGYPTN